MSFSADIKKELALKEVAVRHCNIAEIAAIINQIGVVSDLTSEKNSQLKIHTENPNVARKYFTLIKKTFNINVEVTIKRNKNLHKNRTYEVFLFRSEDVKKVLQACHLVIGNQFERLVDDLIVQSTCCKKAYLRGAFLASGSVSDPEKTYHLEIVNKCRGQADQLCRLLAFFDLTAKVIERKRHYVVYLKEGAQIVSMLSVVGAHGSLLQLENLRILKEVRNSVNRIVNCETANLNKTVTASARQIADIEYIEQHGGIDSLAEPLQEIALLRKEYFESSLKELGQRLSPPIGRSGVNHRLRKLSEIANQLREERKG